MRGKKKRTRFGAFDVRLGADGAGGCYGYARRSVPQIFESAKATNMLPSESRAPSLAASFVSPSGNATPATKRATVKPMPAHEASTSKSL